MAPRGRNGWERWRGEVDEWRTNVDLQLTRIEDAVKSIAGLKVKLGVLWGLSGLVLGAVADAVVRKLLG